MPLLRPVLTALTVCSALAACSTGLLRVSTDVQAFVRPASTPGAPIQWRGALPL